jgi:hypothetical protein
VAHYIVAICRFCGREYHLKPAAAGRRARCKECGEIFQVPTPTSNLDDTVAQWLLEDQGRETRKQESGCCDAIEDTPTTAASCD